MSKETPLYESLPSEDRLTLEEVLLYFEESKLSPPLRDTRGAIISTLTPSSISTFFGKKKRPTLTETEYLGSGVYSKAYLVQLHEKDGDSCSTPLVLKRTIIDELEENMREIAVDMAIRECGALAVLSGTEGIVQFIALFFNEAENTLNTLLNYIPGKQLFDEEARDKYMHSLKTPELYLVGEQLIRIVSNMHKKGIIHGDLKPAQLIVDPSDHFKTTLLDFQMANWEDDRPPFWPDDGLMGSAAYMSPELMNDDWFHGRFHHDLWALGVTLFEMFSEDQSQPFGHPTERSLRRALLEYPHYETDIPYFNDIKNPALRRLIQRILAKKPEKRYQSAEEMLTDYLKIDPNRI
jgi:serine/threonine protein kinase